MYSKVVEQFLQLMITSQHITRIGNLNVLMQKKSKALKSYRTNDMNIYLYEFSLYSENRITLTYAYIICALEYSNFIAECGCIF